MLNAFDKMLEKNNGDLGYSWAIICSQAENWNVDVKKL